MNLACEDGNLELVGTGTEDWRVSGEARGCQLATHATCSGNTGQLSDPSRLEWHYRAEPASWANN